mmetsp:Transcript_9764/g.35513  ORF Transcript_9764/g.35513 Transcript_9764/m.35513 type:complete len:277 (-) Transcript_9764:418-1248(-)
MNDVLHGSACAHTGCTRRMRPFTLTHTDCGWCGPGIWSTGSRGSPTASIGCLPLTPSRRTTSGARARVFARAGPGPGPSPSPPPPAASIDVPSPPSPPSPSPPPSARFLFARARSPPPPPPGRRRSISSASLFVFRRNSSHSAANALSSFAALACALCSACSARVARASSPAFSLASSFTPFTASCTSPLCAVFHARSVTRRACLARCDANSSGFFVVNAHPSTSHRSVSARECIALTWYVSEFLARNVLPHPGCAHANGRSSVCVRSCATRSFRS